MKFLKGRYRWFIAVVLFLATTINYVDRQLLGLLKPMLEKEFDWSESDYALMVTSFSGAYAIGLLFAGRLIDRVGTKLGLTLSVLFWSIAGMGHAMARSVFGFSFARFTLGLSESGNFPAAAKAVAEWFPQRERGLATGIFNSGPSVGVVVTLIIVPFILQHWGWKEAFWITGSLGLLWMALWWAVYDLPHRHSQLTASERLHILGVEESSSLKVEKVSWLKLFRVPQTWALVAGKAFIDPIFWFFLFWLPSYFSEVFTLDLKRPSLPLITIYLAATVGSLGGGLISSWLIRRGWNGLVARKFSLLIFALLELSVIFIQFAPGPWTAVVLISLAIAVHQAWSTNIFTMASDLFPVSAVASVAGIAGMAGSLGGMIFPLIVGALLDAWKAAGNITTGYHILFTSCGLTYLLAVGIIHWFTRKNQPVAIEKLNG